MTSCQERPRSSHRLSCGVPEAADQGCQGGRCNDCEKAVGERCQPHRIRLQAPPESYLLSRSAPCCPGLAWIPPPVHSALETSSGVHSGLVHDWKVQLACIVERFAGSSDLQARPNSQALEIEFVVLTTSPQHSLATMNQINGPFRSALTIRPDPEA